MPRIYKRMTAGRQGTVVRSGLEKAVLEQLEARGIAYEYEQVKLRYIVPVQKKLYMPDFVLPSGIIIETKGEFSSADRKKTLLVLEGNPEIDLRFVFSNPGTRIQKGSKTTYALWCEQHCIPWAGKLIPESWLRETKPTPYSKRRKS